jgi:hypothetical protein
VPPFLFVVGAERSGTTMLRTMLDGHHDLAVVYEPHVVTELDSPAVRHADGTVHIGRLAKAFVEHRWFARWEMTPDTVAEVLAQAEPVYFAEAIRCLYAFYARVRGKRRYGDKSPSYIEQLLRIGETFPEARFVHLLRDGRDASRSLQQAPWGPDDFAGCVRQWRDWVASGLRAGVRLGVGRYLEVRYEELVDDPGQVLRAICDFADLTFDEQMLSFHRRAEDVLRHERPNYHPHLGEPLQAGLRNWRRDLSDKEAAEFEQIAGALSERLGYGSSAVDRLTA